MHGQLHSDSQTHELLVHPDANIYQQLQLALQDAGLVVEARFGGEAIQRGDCFEEWGMEGGAVISVVAERIDDMSDEEYAALGPDVQEALTGMLQW